VLVVFTGVGIAAYVIAVLRCHRDRGRAAQFPTADERWRQFVRVLQSQESCGCAREIILFRKPILVVGYVSHKSLAIILINVIVNLSPSIDVSVDQLKGIDRVIEVSRGVCTG
jgi:hypothetical protein